MDEIRKTIQDLQVQLSMFEEALGNPAASEGELHGPWYNSWTLSSRITRQIGYLSVNVSEHLRKQEEG